MDDKILNYVLTIGPFAGKRIGEAADLLLSDGTWRDIKPGILHISKGVDWMGWYLTHHASWMAESGWVAADRKEISEFLIRFKSCYNVEPYSSWASGNV